MTTTILPEQYEASSVESATSASDISETSPDSSEPQSTTSVESKPFEFSDQQREGLDRIGEWWEQKDNLEYKLGGYAGTGKTVLIAEQSRRFTRLGIPHEIVSFTGKAVSVLRKKGLYDARTMHNLLYKVVYDPYTDKYHMERQPSLYECKAVIVDESSMVNTQLYDDLMYHGVKVLWVGDPAQLEPIGDNPRLANDPDYTLTEIHRQAESSPILRMSRAIRQGMRKIPLGRWERDGSSLHILDRMNEIEDRFNVVICGKNATRHRLNELRRKQRGYGDEILVEGETVICLKNARDYGVYNGMTFKVQKLYRDSLVGSTRGYGTKRIFADLVDEIGTEFPNIPISTEFFGKDYRRELDRDRNSIPFDYGYALTAHKSQGSEWDDVLVIDEPIYGSDSTRWRYTAITRAAKNLTYLL